MALPKFYSVDVDTAWEDDDFREYGPIEKKVDSLHARDEYWWVRLPRWTKDPDLKTSHPREDEMIVYPRVDDVLSLKNRETGDRRRATVRRYTDRVPRGRRLTGLILSF